MNDTTRIDSPPITIPQNTSAVSVYIESRNQISNKGWQNMLNLLKKWRIKELFIQGQLSSDHAIYRILRAQKDRSLNQIKLIYQFDFNIQSFLNKNPKALDATLLSIIYSTRQSYSAHKSWGKSIQKIYGWRPEIIEIDVNKKSTRRQIDDPGSVYSIIKIWNEKDETFFKDVAKSLNRESGWIRIATDEISKFSLLIIRSAKIINDGATHYFMNYFSKTQLQAAQKYFMKKLLPKGIHEYGVYYELEKIIPLEGSPHWLFSAPEIDEKIGNELNIAFASTIINDYKTTFRYSEVVHKIRNKFLTNIFPILESASDVVYYKAHDDFPFPTDGLPKNIYFEVDEDRFVQPAPYYWETITKLRLNTILPGVSQHTLTIMIHDLLNTKYSFSEKKFHVDQLLLFGGDNISFRLGFPWFERLLQLSDDIGATDPNIPGYQSWFQYIEQLSGFLNKGREICEVLVLNSTPKSDCTLLHETLQQLNKIGVSYLLLDVDRFEDDTLYSVENYYLQTETSKFRIILLPGLPVISLKALKKIHRFVKKGGIAVALAHLPNQSSRPEEREKIEEIKQEIWLKESGGSITLYRQGKPSGVAYYIPDVENFDINIPEIYANLNIKIHSSSGNVVHSIREDKNNYLLFVLNLNNEASEDIEIHSAYYGDIFSWDFVQQQANPYPHWDFADADKGVVIRLKLSGHESRLLIINKTDGKNAVRLRNCRLDGLDYIRMTEGKASLCGWQRATGKYQFVALKGEQEIIVKYKVEKKLPVLKLSDKNWFLESNSFNGKVNLNDVNSIIGQSCEALIYHKLIIISEEYTNNMRLTLDLGDLNRWRQVFINDTFVGQSLYPPWRLDITDHIKEGQNKISIKIISNLSNLLAEELNHSQLNYPLLECGLLGQASIIPYSIIEIDAK